MSSILKGGAHINPFLSVWLHPKQTARFLIEQKTVQYSIILVVIGFMASSLSGFQGSGVYPGVPYIWLFLLMVIAVPLFGVVMYLLSIAVSFFVGKLFGGTGEFWDVGKALSLSSIPMIVVWPVYIVWILISPESFFLEGSTGFMSIIGNLILFVTSVWSFVITVGALAEAHSYSNWRSFFTLILPGILIFSALIAIIFFLIAIFTAIIM